MFRGKFFFFRPEFMDNFFLLLVSFMISFFMASEKTIYNREILIRSS
jgi:hypothetical protein